MRLQELDVTSTTFEFDRAVIGEGSFDGPGGFITIALLGFG